MHTYSRVVKKKLFIVFYPLPPANRQISDRNLTYQIWTNLVTWL